MIQFPVDSILQSLSETLQKYRNAVLVAPPGAGKTTRVPLALLEEDWLVGRKILMLEPRRLAARSAARFMAASLGESVGERVGYRVRLDSRVGPKTGIEVITEGVLTRILQADPALEDVGLVIFDEFHERSLQADLGLALCLQSQSLLREDLRLLVMSATLDTEPVAALLGNVPVVQSEGRAYPVETQYLERSRDGSIEPLVVRAIQDSLHQDPGDILVFLPGAGEIGRIEDRLVEMRLDKQVMICPLYGNLSQDAQDKAIAPSPPGVRKVVLATSIAETSLTVEGVRVVIDSGLMRVPRFSPRTGMTRLETVLVSRASADQRRGRAGRLAPGKCYRLWTRQEDLRLLPQGTPEISQADLAPLALELAAWGISDPAELSWLDPPPKGAFDQACALLRQLGALGGDGKITSHGRQMAESGLHPRLAHMIVQAIPLGQGGLACELAAILSERDIFRISGTTDGDIRLRVEALRADKEDLYGVGKAALRRARTEAKHWKRVFQIPLNNKASEINASGLLLAFAYPDRIAQGRGGGRYLLRNGRGAALAKDQPLAEEPYLVAVELDDQGAEGRIFLAAPVELSDLMEYFREQVEIESVVAWDRSAQAVRARKRERLGSLILKEVNMTDADPEATVAALLDGILEEGHEILPWTKAARQFQYRLQFMHRQNPTWPDMSESVLKDRLSEWLGPHLYGLRSREDLQSLNIVPIFESMLSWEQRRELDESAPTHILVPSGQRIPIDYSVPESPVLAVRLQEMFGLAETPTICRGRVPLTLHLLSPAHRPVQVTRDLANFWRETYFEVRKDLKGRYPKHYWPDDPWNAIPTNRVRPRV
ncbi:ATP-dependent helicase HrpB [Heliobacterium chlorum]|uniref:ATP-dependent helicase HrpB n=1 Tax=Heliobacterium chlorum TaxID=2698 RepID=A0ABR7T6S5_HELCL|nr:ATP-dependent helicase HrpB [Heliobacterium chlorum]